MLGAALQRSVVNNYVRITKNYFHISIRGSDEYHLTGWLSELVPCGVLFDVYAFFLAYLTKLLCYNRFIRQTSSLGFHIKERFGVLFTLNYCIVYKYLIDHLNTEISRNKEWSSDYKVDCSISSVVKVLREHGKQMIHNENRTELWCFSIIDTYVFSQMDCFLLVIFIFGG